MTVTHAKCKTENLKVWWQSRSDCSCYFAPE